MNRQICRSMEIQADTVLSTEHDNARPAVEIVVPVYNEQRDLAASIRRLQAFVSSSFPFSARVTIADNGSTDGTWAIATALAGWLPGLRALRIPEAGRGRALQTVWSTSDAEVVAYMDVDLSTDLSALLPLVAPLLSGHSDLAIGTRLSGTARVVRGVKRELISRSYNAILHAVLATRFSDAQCGFKAIRTDRARSARSPPSVRRCSGVAGSRGREEPASRRWSPPQASGHSCCWTVARTGIPGCGSSSSPSRWPASQASSAAP